MPSGRLVRAARRPVASSGRGRVGGWWYVRTRTAPVVDLPGRHRAAASRSVRPPGPPEIAAVRVVAGGSWAAVGSRIVQKRGCQGVVVKPPDAAQRDPAGQKGWNQGRAAPRWTRPRRYRRRSGPKPPPMRRTRCPPPVRGAAPRIPYKLDGYKNRL